jgi:hypothetical protein
LGDLVLLLLIITPRRLRDACLCTARAVRNGLRFGGACLLVYTQIAVAALLGGATDPTSTSQTVSHWVGPVVGMGSWSPES